MAHELESHLVLFDLSGSSGIIDVKVDGSLIDEEWSFQMLSWSSFSKMDLKFHLLLKLPLKEFEL